jgi:hypothetical protein
MEPRRHGRQSRGHISRSRTIPLPGDGDEDGNWFKCWSCGMHCNDVTDEIDDGASKAHTTHIDYPILALGDVTESSSIIAGGELMVIKVAEADSNGDSRTVVHAFKIVDTRGCPNDGNLNWMGNH